MFKFSQALEYLAISTLLVIGFSAQKSQAETFSITNKSLNTNSGFRRIDGQPRISIWDTVANDPDQDFQRIQGNRGGVLLKHKTTGNCLNAYRKWDGAEPNVWPCNPNDPDQNWQVNSLGGNVVQLKLAGTNLCLDTPTRNNGSVVRLWNCVPSHENQRWTSNGIVKPSAGKSEGFFQWANVQVGIGRLDRADLRGECVTLIVRYLQDVYLNQSRASRGYGNGKDVAAGVANQHSNLFETFTSSGLPKRGAIVSFKGRSDLFYLGQPLTNFGHVGIVMESRTVNGQRQIKMMDSNGDSRGPNSRVKIGDWISLDGSHGGLKGWTNPR